MNINRLISTLLSAFIFILAAAPTSAQQPTRVTEQDISDAYIYLLGRLLVTHQQQLDFQDGFKWNELVHRKPGKVDWPNPNLDVAYSEAWVAIDAVLATFSAGTYAPEN
jgi:hypothetical protein